MIVSGKYKLNNPCYIQMDIEDNCITIWNDSRWVKIIDQLPELVVSFDDGVQKPMPVLGPYGLPNRLSPEDHLSHLMQFLVRHHKRDAFRMPNNQQGFIALIVHENDVSLYHRYGYDIDLYNNNYCDEKKVTLNQTHFHGSGLDPMRIWQVTL